MKFRLQQEKRVKWKGTKVLLCNRPHTTPNWVVVIVLNVQRSWHPLHKEFGVPILFIHVCELNRPALIHPAPPNGGLTLVVLRFERRPTWPYFNSFSTHTGIELFESNDFLILRFLRKICIVRQKKAGKFSEYVHFFKLIWLVPKEHIY